MVVYNNQIPNFIEARISAVLTSLSHYKNVGSMLAK
jgi:hypothetical protein